MSEAPHDGDVRCEGSEGEASPAGEPARNIVFTAGSVLRGDDAAGPMLAKMLQDDPVAGWEVVDGGQTPEDDLYYIREVAPARVLFVDAAQMGVEVGAIRKISVGDVADRFLFTTHSLPVTFLLNRMAEYCSDITFLGVQVRSTEFFDPLSPEVASAVEAIAQCVREGGDFGRFESMA